MREIGGYIEFEHYNRPMLHEDGIKLNCGRNALAYLIEANGIKNIAMPRYMCDSCDNILKKYHVDVRYYSIGLDFKYNDIIPGNDEWLYVVNFYGQLSNQYIEELKENNSNIIIDNSQAYFQRPITGIDTIYTCRKFFGVADGAILYTDKVLKVILQDESFDRMKYLLARFERNASDYYSEFCDNENVISAEPLKKMSKLTENLLRGIEYDKVSKKRTENFRYLYERFSRINRLSLSVPEGAFMYPLYIENGAEIRTMLHKKNIYVPTLWPSVFNLCSKDELEYDMAMNILPLPVDQRYDIEDMEYMTREIIKYLDY